MNNPTEDQNQIRHVIVVLVKPNRKREYEAWLKKVRDTIVTFEGFITMDVIRQKETTNPEYVVINRFRSHKDYLRWNDSLQLKTLVEEASDFVLARKINIQRIGIDMFFDPPNLVEGIPTDASGTPLWYKKIAIGIITVYPIILVSKYTLSPVLDKYELPMWLGILISTCIISPLIGWSLPLVSRLFRRWLYP